MANGYESLAMFEKTAEKFRLIAAHEERSLVKTLDRIANQKLAELGITYEEKNDPRNERKNRKAA